MQYPQVATNYNITYLKLHTVLLQLLTYVDFKLKLVTAEVLSKDTFTMLSLESVRYSSMVDVEVTETDSVISAAVGEHVQVRGLYTYNTCTC